MIDSRFYDGLAPLTSGELADLIKAPRPVEARLFTGVASLEAAGPEDIAYCTDRSHAAALAVSRAGAVILTPDLAARAPTTAQILISAHPAQGFALAANQLISAKTSAGQGAEVHAEAIVEPGAMVSPGASIGPGAEIGAGARIAPGVVIGPGVAVGRGCVIGSNVSIHFALIGDRVTISAGAVIGESGFGVAAGPAGLVDLPHLGRVVIQDGVSIGANSCVDRGFLGDTVIGEGTRIDNLVQIAHNVRIGRFCVLAAQTGISGSVTIGDGCQLGGRVGVADHLTIGAGARLAAASGVAGDVPSGETWAGYPARPRWQWLRETVWLTRAAAVKPDKNKGH
jgi:UDP-3-O-[3-hydroxymyristoyl] glucosamine N-acyltransferase